MSTPEQQGETRDRILEATLHAIGRRGVQKLSMNDVTVSAGISRSTLYRYFPGKEELLDALVRYEQRRFDASLSAAVGDVEGDRLQATIDHAAAYLRDHPTLNRVLEVEPGFVLRYLRQHVPSRRRAARTLLGDVLDEVPVVAAGVIGADALADVLIRLLVANFLIPGDGDGDAADLKAVFALLAGAEPGTRLEAIGT